jgi:hypothetical protein
MSPGDTRLGWPYFTDAGGTGTEPTSPRNRSRWKTGSACSRSSSSMCRRMEVVLCRGEMIGGGSEPPLRWEGELVEEKENKALWRVSSPDRGDLAFKLGPEGGPGCSSSCGEPRGEPILPLLPLHDARFRRWLAPIRRRWGGRDDTPPLGASGVSGSDVGDDDISLARMVISCCKT